MASRIRLLAGLAAAVLPSVVAAQPQPTPTVPIVEARPVSLDEAVRLAQQNSPAAVQARGALRSSGAQVRRNYATFLPNVLLSRAKPISLSISPRKMRSARPQPFRL